MGKAIILAYDLGTSGVKASMINEDGVIRATCTVPYHTYYLRDNIAEQNAEDWWKAVIDATQLLIEKDSAVASDIAVIGVSGHMLGCLPVDQNNNPLLPHMLHSDGRSVKQYETIRREIGADYLYKMSGNILDVRSTLCKILWIKENAPEIYARTYKFLQSKDYITAKLTGNPDTTDYSDACHAELMNIEKRAYEPEIYSQLGLSVDKLPELHRGIDVIGHVTEESAALLGVHAGIPVIAGGGDGACSTLGAGNTMPGEVHLSLGTTAWFAGLCENPIIDPHARLFNIMNLDGETCCALGAMQAAGASIRWVCSLLGIDVSEISGLASTVSEGSEGLIYLPYLDGERTPVYDINACGVFMGISQKHTNAHFARAVMEGVAYALKQIVECLHEFMPFSKAAAIGGGMKSSLWAQIISDITGIELDVLSVPADDATSLGIASAAGTAVGIFSDLKASIKHIQTTAVIHPNQMKTAYCRNFGAYGQLYPKLKDIMTELARKETGSLEGDDVRF